MPEPIVITAPSANLISVDPTSRMNTIAMVQLANKIIAEHRAGDLKIDQKFSTAVTNINTAIEALAEQVRVDPKKIEAKLREQLNDPAVRATLIGSLANVPGMDVTIGSAVKAQIEEPKVIEFHLHTDPTTELMTGVTAIVQSGATISQSIFTGTSAEFDNDNDGIADQIVTTLTTENFAGVPATFRVFIAKRNDVVSPAVGQVGTPGFIEAFTLSSYNKTGQSAVVIDLAPRFQTAVQTDPPALIDIDGDGLEGFGLPEPVRVALLDLQTKILARNAAITAAAAAQVDLVAKEEAKAEADAELAAAAELIEAQVLAAQSDVNAAAQTLAALNVALAQAQQGVFVSQEALALADNVTVMEAHVADKQAALNDATLAGSTQSVLDGLQAELDAAIAALAAAEAAYAAASNSNTNAQAALDSIQDDVDAAVLVKADADAALALVLAPLSVPQQSADDAAADVVAAQGLVDEKTDAVESATTLAQAALVAFEAAKVEHQIGSDYGLPNYTV